MAIVIAAYAYPDISPLPKSIFTLPYPKLSAELYRTFLTILPRLLSDIRAYRAFWEDEDRNLTESEELINGEVIMIEERPDLDLAIVRIPESLNATATHRCTSSRLSECHTFAILHRTPRSRLL